MIIINPKDDLQELQPTKLTVWEKWTKKKKQIQNLSPMKLPINLEISNKNQSLSLTISLDWPLSKWNYST